jgi:hypothetical protein
MDGSSPAAPMPGASLTANSARRMMRSAAALWAAAGLPGEGFDAALAEAREAFRAEAIRIQRESDRT